MGGLFGGGKQKQTTTSTPDPLTQKWRTDIYDRAQTALNDLPEYYRGDTVANMSATTRAGLDSMAATARGGVPGLAQGYGAAQSLMTGQGIAGMDALKSFDGAADNPYLRQMYEQGAGDLTDAVNAQFAKSGRYGSNAAYAGGLTKGLGNLYTSIYAPAYENAQGRKLQASSMLANLDSSNKVAGANMLPSLYETSLMPGQTLASVGSIYDQQNQAEIDAQKEKWDYNENKNWDFLQKYAAMMNGMPTFGSQTTTTKGGGNLLGSLGSLFSGIGALRN